VITLSNVHKRYRTAHGAGPWVLSDINLRIPSRCNVGLIGRNGAGKSTLLRLIGGMDYPTRGQVRRACRVSWPLGLAGGLKGSLSGRQNASFVCRIHGREADLRETLRFVEDFSELGAALDEPVQTYSSGMQARLKFALSMAFDFDLYLVDELTAVGDAAFKRKSREAFQRVADHAGLIMVSHDERTLREYCQAGILLRDGQAQWYDNIDEALALYREGLAA
jgi:capsular polysaccharide transport system ATP-binding protein